MLRCAIMLFFVLLAGMSYSQFRIIEETSDRILLEILPGEVQFVDEITPCGLMKKPVVNNGTWLLRRGYPELQKLTASFIIPPEGSATVQVIEADYYQIDSIEICPSRGSLTRDIDPSTVPHTKAKIYERDEFWPETLALLREPYIMRELRGQTLVVIPFAYNSIRKILKVYTRLILEITFNQQPSRNQLLPVLRYKPDREFYQMYQRHFLNFPEDKYVPVNEDGSMLVISYGPYIQAMQPFVIWKNQKGIPTEIIDVATIGNTSQDIKDFVVQYYWQNNLKYLLLVGDAEHIPPMTTSAGPSDNAYGYIVGDDHYPDIFVGRVSAENVQHVVTQVQRVLNYEKDPQLNEQWYSRGAGIASQEGPGHNGLYDHEHSRFLRTKLLGYTYTSISEHYEGTQGGQDLPGDPTATQVLNDVNTGLSIINYTGHGGATGWVTSGFSNTHVNQLININQLPFIWSVACVNGLFLNGTCFAEAWLRASHNNQPTGAIAVLMSTVNQYWNEPMCGQLEMVDILVESYQNNKPRSFGGISMNGCMKMNDEYGQSGYDMTDTWTVFGDPSVIVRTAPPAIITASHPAVAVLGQDALEITCNTNDALVCLSIDGKIIAKGQVQNHTSYLTFSPLNDIDTIDVVITAFNHKPYIGQIDIIAPSGPWIKKYEVQLVDQNNNQLVEYGEIIQLNLALQNIGSDDAHQVTAHLIPQSGGQFVNMIKDSVYFGNIAVQQIILKTDAFRFSVSNNIPNNTQLVFQLRMSTPDTTWISYVSFQVAAPQFMVQHVTVQEIQGNMNGRLDPGEKVFIHILTRNDAITVTPQSTANLSSSSQYVSVLTPQVQPGIFQPQETKIVSFEVDVNQQTPAGMMIPFYYQCVADSYQVMYQFQLICGLMVEDWEMNNFMQFPWDMNNYGDVPWYIVGAGQAYEGDYCVRSGQISDNQQSILQITLTAATADSISFYRKVSCEEGSVYGVWWDYLEFTINGQMKGRWDGEKGWERVSYAVPAGTHTYRWTYKKDYMISEGEDAAWVDFIVFPPVYIDTTSIQDEQFFALITCYPSPAKDMIMVEISGCSSGKCRLMIADNSGRILLQEPIQNCDSGITVKKSFSLTGLPAGTYFVIWQDDTQKIVYPFVKMQ